MKSLSVRTDDGWGYSIPTAESLQHSLKCPHQVGLSCLPLDELTRKQGTIPAIPPSLRKAVPKRQREYLAGRLCAAEALQKAGHSALDFLDMGADNLPVWPGNWIGSISHSGEYAIALAGPRQCFLALGVDIQQQISPETMENIQPVIMNDEECARLQSFDLQTSVPLVFSAKESLYKALFPLTRKIQGFDAANLIGVDNDSVLFELAHDWSEQWHKGLCIRTQYALFNDYVVTATYLE